MTMNDYELLLPRTVLTISNATTFTSKFVTGKEFEAAGVCIFIFLSQDVQKMELYDYGNFLVTFPSIAFFFSYFCFVHDIPKM